MASQCDRDMDDIPNIDKPLKIPPPTRGRPSNIWEVTFRGNWCEMERFLLNYKGKEREILSSRREGDQFTPLILAVSLNHFHFVSKLLRRSWVDIDAVSVYGASSLCYCVYRTNNISLLKLLLEYKPNLDLQRLRDGDGSAGWTAVMHATATGKIDMAEILILAGANVTLKDQRGLDCFDLIGADFRSGAKLLTNKEIISARKRLKKIVCWSRRRNFALFLAQANFRVEGEWVETSQSNTFNEGKDNEDAMGHFNIESEGENADVVKKDVDKDIIDDTQRIAQLVLTSPTLTMKIFKYL